MANPLSKECCSLPQVVVENYEPKGKYETFEELKTYIVGSTDAKKAVLFIYDVFAFANQTVQAADMLASDGFLVLMPDVLEGGIDPSLFPTDTPEKQKALAEFFGENGAGNLVRGGGLVASLAAAIRPAYPSVENVGSIGLCLGGKFVILGTIKDEGKAINASAQVHPGLLTKDDAPGLKVPHLVLASKGENVNDVKEFDEAEKPAGSETHTYANMHHGWAGARANLKDEENAKEFKRAYEQYANWLNTIFAK